MKNPALFSRQACRPGEWRRHFVNVELELPASSGSMKTYVVITLAAMKKLAKPDIRERRDCALCDRVYRLVARLRRRTSVGVPAISRVRLSNSPAGLRISSPALFRLRWRRRSRMESVLERSMFKCQKTGPAPGRAGVERAARFTARSPFLLAGAIDSGSAPGGPHGSTLVESGLSSTSAESVDTPCPAGHVLRKE